MQSAKKRTIALSALSMAAVATLGAKSAHAVAFGFYYDNINVLTAQQTDAGGDEAITSSGTVVSSFSAATINATPTITLSVGQVLEFGMDAAVTGSTGAAAGNTVTQGKIPTNLGAALLGIQINSSDATGAKLTPLSNGSGTGNNTATSFLNDNPGAGSAGPQNGGSQNGTNATGQGPNNGATNGAASPIIPNWNSEYQIGDVETNSGTVGGVQTINGDSISASNGIETTSAATLESIGSFGASANNLANATDFFDSLQYSATATGTVTLSPFSHTGQDEYWTQTNSSTGTAARFKIDAFGTTVGDTVLAIPQLVIVIAATGGGGTTTPLFSLTTATPTLYGSQITNGTGNLQGTFSGTGASVNKLTLNGQNGFYSVQQATGIKDGAGNVAGPGQAYIEANGFSPATDKELFALDIEVGGTAASGTQLNTLLAQATSVGGLPAGVSVATSLAGVDPFPSNYNFFVLANPGVGADDFLGFDLLSSNDSNLVGYTASAVAVVPEPMSLGLLALGGVGLMARRNRRKA